MERKLISVVTACYNEEDNVEDLHREVSSVMERYKDKYDYEHIFIDNASKDKTVERIKSIIERDKRVRLIVNARNFGQFRSPYHAYLQSRGDALISIVADLQDPPSLIPEFIKKWEEGNKVVVAIKTESKENRLMFFIRKIFYNIMSRISETEHIKDFTGFGLYDREFVDVLKKIDEPDPYFRGLISDIGFARAEVPFVQPKRKKGVTKNNFYTLYDIAMLAFVNHSKLPLRLASFAGFSVAFLSILVASVYLIYKLLFWASFELGMAPLVIGIFFLGGIQLLFLGVIGEYIGAIFTQVKKRPLVVEKERVNFENC